jgi:hypothetical protein
LENTSADDLVLFVQALRDCLDGVLIQEIDQAIERATNAPKRETEHFSGGPPTRNDQTDGRLCGLPIDGIASEYVESQSRGPIGFGEALRSVGEQLRSAVGDDVLCSLPEPGCAYRPESVAKLLSAVESLSGPIRGSIIKYSRKRLTATQNSQVDRIIERLRDSEFAGEATLVGAAASQTSSDTASDSPPKSSDEIPSDEEFSESFDGPRIDEHDDRVVWWIDKRIYLGRDTQISRLFWLLARPVGAACSLAEMQRALDGMETNTNVGSASDEIEKAGIRLRKAIAKLRAALRDSGLDSHFVIHRGGGQGEPEYSLIPRYTRSR